MLNKDRSFDRLEITTKLIINRRWLQWSQEPNIHWSYPCNSCGIGSKTVIVLLSLLFMRCNSIVTMAQESRPSSTSGLCMQCFIYLSEDKTRLKIDRRVVEEEIWVIKYTPTFFFDELLSPLLCDDVFPAADKFAVSFMCVEDDVTFDGRLPSRLCSLA